MKNRIWLAGLCLVTSVAFAGEAHREGNGGDHVRATFMMMGKEVVSYLKETQPGIGLAVKHDLDLTKLDDTLTIDTISAVDAVLIDNGGSVVDALGEPGKISLDKNQWFEHFEKERDVYYLVFHEMLRAVGVNDDNYIISGSVRPFPTDRKIKSKVGTTVALIDTELLTNIVNYGVTAFGSGCAAGASEVDFDAEKNMVDINVKDYALKANDMRVSERKACSISMPVKVSPGKRIVVSQVDLVSRVDLPAKVQAAVSFESYLTGTKGKIESKRVGGGNSPVKGRVVLRSNPMTATKCGSSGDIIKLNTAASLTNNRNAKGLNQIDRITLYFKVEDCKP